MQIIVNSLCNNTAGTGRLVMLNQATVHFT